MDRTFGQRFGDLIARKREERGWSFAQLAVAAYGDDGHGGEKRKADVQKLEAGNSRKPNAATIRKYRLALDLTQKDIDACRTSEEIELAKFARTLFDVIADGAKAAGLTEDLALAVSDHYAENNHGNFEGALASLKDALAQAAKDQARGKLPSNYEDAAEAIIQRVNALNAEGDIDEAYATLQAEAARRAEALEAQKAEDKRILDLLITQAALANDAEGYAQAHLQLVQLDSPNAEDTFHRLRDLRRERYQEGLRLGTPFALTAAAGLARQCAQIAPTPYLRAMAQNDLGCALDEQGSRSDGAAGNALRAEAVDCYRAALRVRIEADHPVDWAMTMQNLAGALQTQGKRTDGAEGNALLAEAVDSYRAALRVFTETEHPVEWAMTMQNLAIALQNQGNRTAGPEGNGLLAEAVDSHRAALRVRTEADHPMDWAMTMQNLAGALQTQGSRTDGPEGNALLAEAVDSYRAALRVTTEAEHPVQWAITQDNLSLTEAARAEHGTTTDPQPHLSAALAHIDNALRIYDPVHMSYNHAKASRLRERILEAIHKTGVSSSS